MKKQLIIQKMLVKDLKALAESKGIDTTGKLKADLIASLESL